MNKDQLKKLVREVISEAEGMSAGDYEDTQDLVKKGLNAPGDKGGEEKKPSDTTVTLSISGVPSYEKYKELLAAMAWAAKMAQLNAIHAEIERGGKSVLKMNKAELATASKEFEEEPDDEKQANVAALKASGLNVKGGTPSPAAPSAAEPKAAAGSFEQQVNLSNLDADEKAEWDNPKTKPARRRELVRLSKIKRGEKSADWEKATKDDEASRIAKERMKKAAIAAGTYDPRDSKYWTDRQWDAFATDMESGKSQQEAIHRAALIDDPTNKKYWSGVEYSIYNTEIRQNRKSPQDAMNTVIRSTWDKDQVQRYQAAKANGKTEQEAMKVGADYKPKFTDIGAAKMKLPKTAVGTLREAKKRNS